MADSKLLKFTDRAQAYPSKRAADERTHDFLEIARPYIVAKAEEQAARCSQCGVPFCQVHCPLHNNIPDWLKLTAEGRLEEAYQLSQATNSMPEICGRICPQDRLCEGSCVIEKDFGSVTIGAGPAGLAAAELLREQGYAVTVYDRHDRAGGLLIYGIPGFKLEKEVVERRTQRLADGGVVFKLGFEVGKDATLEDLRNRHDAVLIAVGVYAARDLVAPGSGNQGVVPALDYLIASNKKTFGDDVPAYDSGELNAAGKDVVVVGGGDTAMDCVRTAIRQGATSVTCLYRRDKANMPGSLREVANAEEEGVTFEWLAAPRAVMGDATGVTGVRAIRMRLGAPDASGRQSPEEIDGGDFDRPAQLVVKALGFEPENLPETWSAPDLKVTRWGTVKADVRHQMTNLDGVFAAGDIVRGASLVVWAIKDGRDAADAIHRYLTAKVSATLIAAE